MKKYLLSAVTILAIFLPFTSYGSYSPLLDNSLGSPLNPIYLRLIPPPPPPVNYNTVYGASKVAACQNSLGYFTKDLSDPHVMEQMWKSIDYCLKMGAAREANGNQSNSSTESVISGPTQCSILSGMTTGGPYVYDESSKKCVCTTGYKADSNGKCIKYACLDGEPDVNGKCPLLCLPSQERINGVCQDLCQKPYGLNASAKQITDPKSPNYLRYECSCKTGFQWNPQGTSCVVPSAPVKTNDQICTGDYGNNSVWNGTKNSNGGLVCDCKTGFQWNSQRTSCVQILILPVQNLTPKVSSGSTDTAESKMHNQTCRDAYGANGYWEGTKTADGYINCGCNNGVQLNSQKTNCLAPYKIPKGAVLIKSVSELKKLSKKTKTWKAPDGKIYKLAK